MRAPGMVGGLPGRRTLTAQQLPGTGEPAPLHLHVPSQPGLQVLLDLHIPESQAMQRDVA